MKVNDKLKADLAKLYQKYNFDCIDADIVNLHKLESWAHVAN